MCHLSPVMWLWLYAALAAMKVPTANYKFNLYRTCTENPIKLVIFPEPDMDISISI